MGGFGFGGSGFGVGGAGKVSITTLSRLGAVTGSFAKTTATPATTNTSTANAASAALGNKLLTTSPGLLLFLGSQPNLGDARRTACVHHFHHVLQ